jgi:hypothetical protein
MVWIIVIVVVVLALGVGAYLLMQKQAEAKRTEAGRLREEAVGRESAVERPEQDSAEASARAKAARAEAESREAQAREHAAKAEVKAAEADRLTAAASRKQEASAEARAEIQDQLTGWTPMSTVTAAARCMELPSRPILVRPPEQRGRAAMRPGQGKPTGQTGEAGEPASASPCRSVFQARVAHLMRTGNLTTP